MGNGVAGIMISDRDPAQSSLFGGLDHCLGGTACIRRVMGVEMQIEGVAHWKKAEGKMKNEK
jgi:hypothetical protein